MAPSSVKRLLTTISAVCCVPFSSENKKKIELVHSPEVALGPKFLDAIASQEVTRVGQSSSSHIFKIESKDSQISKSVDQ